MVINTNQKLNKYGSGLGLSIIKEILEENNSSLNIKSKKGEGSEFYFDLIDNDNNIFDPFSFFDNSIKDIIKDINSGKKDDYFKSKTRKNSQKSNCQDKNYKNRSSILIKKISNENINNLDIVNTNNNLILNNNLLSYNNNIDQGSNLTRSMCVIGENEIKKNRELYFRKTNNFRILICDDDNLSSLSTRNIIVKYYKNQNKEASLPEIYFAQNGIECLYSVYNSFMRDDPVDLLLIDKNMPFIDGITTSSLIKNVIELSNIKIYILSSEYVNLDDCKVDGYYDKPLTNEALNQILFGE
jgi:CheY-like chemotaxis protein